MSAMGTFTSPSSGAALPPSEAPPSDLSPSPPGFVSGEYSALGAVLVVDDDVHVRRVARRVLLHAGFSVIEASGGEEALAARRDESVRVACAVVDVTMPGMDGPTCAEHLRQLRPELPVLFCSGYSADESVPGTFDARTAFLPKPYRQRDLVDHVASLLGPAT